MLSTCGDCLNSGDQDRARRCDFVMLIVKSVFVLTLNWLENRLKVRIYDKRSFVRVAKLPEFNVGLLSVWSRKHVQHRHKVLAGAKTLMFNKGLFGVKASKTSAAYIFAILMLRYIK